MATPQSPTLAELPKIPTELAAGVTAHHDLKKVDTIEKNTLPSPQDVQQEKQHVAMLSGIENFHAEQLKKTDVEEKNPLPTKDDIKAEKTHQELTSGIEHFSPERLRRVSTEEKNVLPSKEDLAREKVVDLAVHFDKNQLKHVEPAVKTSIEVIDA